MWPNSCSRFWMMWTSAFTAAVCLFRYDDEINMRLSLVARSFLGPWSLVDLVPLLLNQQWLNWSKPVFCFQRRLYTV